MFDISSGKLTATIPVGVAPHGVAVTPDGARVYVTNFGTDTVSVIDTETNIVVANIALALHREPFGVAISPDGARAYVANYFGSWIAVIDTSSNRVIATIPVHKDPVALAVN